MDIFKVLRDEHEEILRLTDTLQKMCLVLMEENKIDFSAFRNAITFIREYADQLHHQKEEQILFRIMIEHLGSIATNLVQHGMLVEHDLARLHVRELEQALNAYEIEGKPEDKLGILANAMGYCYLLRRHIERENSAVFPYAERSLSAEAIDGMNQKADSF